MTASPTASAPVELIERLFGEFGVFKLAYAGAASSDWREKVAEFEETEKLTRSLLAAMSEGVDRYE